MAKAQGITLSADIDPDLPVCLLDERLIRQVLINLLSNAVKFTTEAGTVRLQASMIFTQMADPLHGTLHISVLDSGIGIDTNDQALIFKPFVQVQSGLNRQFAGTGLGLSIVKRILLAHGVTSPCNRPWAREVVSVFISRLRSRPLQRRIIPFL
ncbi:MAG: ATP-binding protein [Cyanobium sp. CZS 25K]|nr:ATP-binding protein [Cyanobium sp. CZS25K]